MLNHISDNEDKVPKLRELLSKGLSLKSCARILKVSYNVVDRLYKKYIIKR